MCARKITILYGSQTGNAQDVAERLCREAKRRHFSVKISTMDDYDRNLLKDDKYVIFVASTTGQGDAPDNMTVRIIFSSLTIRNSLNFFLEDHCPLIYSVTCKLPLLVWGTQTIPSSILLQRNYTGDCYS
jgi:hypothetical protein